MVEMRGKVSASTKSAFVVLILAVCLFAAAAEAATITYKLQNWRTDFNKNGEKRMVFDIVVTNISNETRVVTRLYDVTYALEAQGVWQGKTYKFTFSETYDPKAFQRLELWPGDSVTTTSYVPYSSFRGWRWTTTHKKADKTFWLKCTKVSNFRMKYASKQP
jgi:hypothetical protein